MSEYARKYIDTRINQIKALHIGASHKAEKLEIISKTIDLYNNGKITEEEALYLIA